MNPVQLHNNTPSTRVLEMTRTWLPSSDAAETETSLILVQIIYRGPMDPLLRFSRRTILLAFTVLHSIAWLLPLAALASYASR